MAEAYKRYQKKKITSNYTEQFGGNMDDKFKYNNIFKYKDFEHVILISKKSFLILKL